MSVFKLIIAGGREFNDYAKLSRELQNLSNNELSAVEIELVSGMARGADALGLVFAHEFHVAVHKFPANWDKYGKRAGFVRNEEMGRFADGLLAFWDGKSVGTKGMIDFMKSLGKSVRVISY